MPQPSMTKIRLKIIYLKFNSNFPGANQLTHKRLEMHGYLISTVPADALVLVHQAISIHNA